MTARAGEMKVRRNWTIRICAAAVVLTAGLATSAWAGELRAGAARVSITPTADEFPYVVAREKNFVGVHDDVYARALVLDNGTTRVAIVTAEVEAIPEPARVVEEVAQAVGVPASNVMVTASHTHGSLTVFIHGTERTPAQKEEIEHVRQGLVEAAKEAAAHLQPARIAFGRGEAFVNINTGEGSGGNRGDDPRGPSDKTVDVVRVESINNQPIALVVAYGTHAQTMFRSVSKDGGYEVTGDIPGAVSRMLETTAAGAPVALYMAGSEGDQHSLMMSLQPAVGKLPATDAGASGWALVDVQARRLTASVLDVLHTMEPGAADVSIEAAAGAVTCPGAKNRVDNQTGQLTQQDTGPVAIPVSTIRVDDIAIVSVGGDMASEVGQKIRAASPVTHTVVTTMVAGAVGYILPDSYYLHPGHAVAGSSLKAGCVEKELPKGIAEMLSGK